MCVWRQKRNGEKPSFTPLRRCERCPGQLPPKLCQHTTKHTSQEGWRGLWDWRVSYSRSWQWINSAASVNLSRGFRCVVSKSLIQAKVPDAHDIPLVSWKSLWSQLKLCHQISGKVRCFMISPCQKEVIPIEKFQVQKWLSSFALQAIAGNSKWLFQSTSNLDTLQWSVKLLSTLSHKALFLGTNNFVKF